MKVILMRLVVAILNPAMIGSIVNIALASLEAAIKSSSTDWDDKNLLPILNKLKNAFR